MTEQITGDRAAPAAAPRAAGAATPGRRTLGPGVVVLSALGVLVVVIVIAGFLIHLPYVIISPGSATPLDSSVVQIDGAQTYPARTGNVLFLTVRVSTRDPNVWRVVDVVARSRPRRREAQRRRSGASPTRRTRRSTPS